MNATTRVKSRKSLKNLTASGVCLALCMLLPFLTGQIPQIGNALSPMHIPVLICGFIAGPFYAAVIGLAAPPLRFALFTTPPMPMGIAMSFELMVYGLVVGLLYKWLPKKNAYIYISLIISMIAGRVVWGIARLLLLGVADLPFTWELFISGALLNAIPGIILHIAIIPVIIMALKRTKAIAE
ncbi:MAG: ECF transporter S component [Oscillospiraceae bacterium]|jgi:riboflavin transporter FmnP|nr:ECF transporter S component [Oscillospiraceae bacterium]